MSLAKNVVILDTGCCNLTSLKAAVERLGVDPIVSRDAAVIRSAQRLFLPGVGTAKAAMTMLRARDLESLIVEARQPVLGICLGMQCAVVEYARHIGMADANTTEAKPETAYPVIDIVPEQKDVEEVGAMNIFFKINGKIVTPELNGSILPGVTRNSVIQMCKHLGYEVEERKISVDELVAAAKDGSLEEVFGTGTAAVISPVVSLRYKDDVVEINNFEIGELTQKLYDTLTGIQYGKIEDTFGWTVKVD